MKPVFAIDITTDKKNETVNGEEFITRRVSKQTMSLFEQKTERLDGTVEKSQLPLWMRILKYVFGFIALIVLAGVLRAGVSLEEALHNAAWLILLGVGSGIGWIALHLISKQKEKVVLAEENAEEQIEDLNADVKAMYAELGVPAGATAIDVLWFRYTDKDGNIKIKAPGIQTFEFFNSEALAFKEDGCLQLASIDVVHSFPLDELKRLKVIKKHSSIASWNKDAGPTEDPYKEFKLTVDQYGSIHIRSYAILELERGGETFGIYFPSYEIDKISILVGLIPEE